MHQQQQQQQQQQQRQERPQPDAWSDSSLESISECYEESSGSSTRGGIDDKRSPSNAKPPHLELPSMDLRRVVPLCVMRLYLLGVGAANAVALARVAAGGTAFYVAMWLLFAAAAFVPAAVTVADWFMGLRERRGFIGVWSAMLVTMNARAYCWSQWASEGKWGWEQYEFAWPHAELCWYFAYAWTLVIFLQHLYIPMGLPASWRHTLGYVALWLNLGLAAVICFYHTSAEANEGADHLGFLRDESQGILPLLSLLMSETLHFLDTGDVHGCRALMLLPLLCWTVPKELYGADWLKVGLEHPMEQPSLAVTIWLVVLISVLHLATATELRIRSTSPLYKAEQEAAGTSTGLKARIKEGKMWLRTWRGANLVYLANGMFSLVGYWSSRHQLLNSMRGSLHDKYADGQGQWYTGEAIVGTTIYLSLACVIVAVLNFLEDGLLGNRRWCTLLPFDRHFRLLTLLKAALLWLKMELLIFTCQECDSPLSTGTMIFQIVSIGITCAVSVSSSVSLFSIARKIMAFESDYRRPRRLWETSLGCMVVITIVNSIMMISKLWGDESTLLQVLHRKGCVGIILWLGQTYYVPFLCLGNEATLFISSKASSPQVFAGVRSTRGVFAFSVLCAAKFPMEVLVNLVECQFLLPSYFSSLFLFSGTWVEPMFGYATALLIVLGLAGYLACGGDGVGLEGSLGETAKVLRKDSAETQQQFVRTATFTSSISGATWNQAV